MSEEESIKVLVLTISDRCSRHEAPDKSGTLLQQLLLQWNVNTVVTRKCVPDEASDIREVINEGYQLNQVIITTGGTGLANRDVTISTISPLLDKRATGVSTALISQTLSNTPFAMLSNPIAGVKGQCFIVCMPGSSKAVKEYMDILLPVLGHIIDLVSDRSSNISSLHSKMQAGGPGHPSTLTSSTHHVCPHKKANGSHQDRQGVAFRSRQSKWPMLKVEEALDIIRRESKDKCPTREAVIDVSPLAAHKSDNPPHGYITSTDTFAVENVPNYRASIKDGYAVVSADGPGSYPVVSVSVMGKGSHLSHLKPGEITRVTTGAPVPEGADAVVQVEDTELVRANDAGDEVEVRILTQVKPGDDIRPVGSDTKTGEIILPKGTLIKSAEMAPPTRLKSLTFGQLGSLRERAGLLVSQGIRKIPVNEKPRVAILSTGDELVTLNVAELQYGQVRDCNSYTLSYLLKEDGFAVSSFKHVPDSFEDTLAALQEATMNADIILSTGGVSMGETDHIKSALAHLGGVIHFGRVFMKPGKPTTFATLPKDTLYFGLPGNPVSTMVTYKLFVLPALKTWQGDFSVPETIAVSLPESRNLDPRPEYIRAVYNKGVTGNQCSSRLLSMRDANILLQLPARSDGVSQLLEGTPIKAMVIGKI